MMRRTARAGSRRQSGQWAGLGTTSRSKLRISLPLEPVRFAILGAQHPAHRFLLRFACRLTATATGARLGARMESLLLSMSATRLSGSLRPADCSQTDLPPQMQVPENVLVQPELVQHRAINVQWMVRRSAIASLAPTAPPPNSAARPQILGRRRCGRRLPVLRSCGGPRQSIRVESTSPRCFKGSAVPQPAVGVRRLRV
jgi:hypothetical protein